MNTLFDSTFMQLGIIVGSVFAANLDLRLIIGTLISGSVALGMSTGISVYESETLERERRIVELEKALFRNLDNTMIAEKYKAYAAVLSVLNFLTPIACCGVVTIPLILAVFGSLNRLVASWSSMFFALGLIFAAGVYLGKNGRQNRVVNGAKMALLGAIAFAVCFLIQSLL